MRAAYVLAICVMATIGTAARAQEIDWKKVDEAIGRSAAVSGDVHRYGFPRSDLSVTLDGVTIRPTLALGSWTAFKPAHGGAMVMGNLVLLDTEVNPVMAKLIENGIEITAVHNHVLRGNPATYVDTFMDVIRWNNVERLLVQATRGEGIGSATGS